MRGRIGRLGSALALAALLALITAACAGRGGDGGGVATLTGGRATGTTGAGGGGDAKGKDPQDAALDFARCMREHGIQNFPDPQVEQDGGRVRVKITPGEGVDPRAPRFRKAEEQCRGKLRAGGTGPAPDDPQAQASMLDFARCMRAHGVDNFPDPQVDQAGGPGLKIGPGSGIDPDSPTFKAAEKACRPKLRLPGRGGARP